TFSRFLRAYLAKPFRDELMEPTTSLDPSSVEWQATIDMIVPRLYEIGALAVLTLLIAPIAMFGRNFVAQRVVARVRQDVDKAVARKFLYAPLRAHREGSSGEFLTRALNDAQLACESLKMIYKDVVATNLLMGLGGVITMVALSWQLALLTLLAVPPLLLVLNFFGRRIHDKSLRRQETQSDLSQRLVGILSGIKVIKAFRGQALEEAAVDRETERYFKRHMKVILNRVAARSATEALNPLSGLLIIGLGAWLAVHGLWGITLGTLIAFAATLMTTYKPVKALASSYTSVMEYAASAGRLFELLDSEEEVPDRENARPMQGLHEGIRFCDVHFAYGESEVLRGIDLEVRPGEVIAFVGRTGTGKSTLMDLLLRFHDPSRGRIEIDGVDLRDLQRNSFLDHVAIVTQEPFLFDASILENIRYGRPEASIEDVRAAAAAARADEFIDQLPTGYDTPVGEFGLQLSGGQRQRITIARAILRDPAILVFDEATSSLDAKTERAVQSAIDALRGERTIFVVAHRLSTIRHADRIVVLDDGRIADIGDHATLMSRPGIYRELVGVQEAAQTSA
ncbi:MAG: ABC transporter ATP-binding protein, partial [Deltaproteobacteria bacterium]|nr:ABC transporter ATP-binding protein [Deltaproteobacteria bacterium]